MIVACSATQVNRTRYRRVTPWQRSLVLEIGEDFITDLDMVTQVLNRAGRIDGIGELSPDTSQGGRGVGSYGRFRAELQ
ncbi:MAG: hypothetical protein AB7K24_21985 [Gemmataceae bacterium]